MSTRFATTDPRPLGAAIALALDAAMIAIAALLVSTSWSGATALVLAGAVGLVIAPAFGWRYARPATDGTARAWVGEAIRRLALTSAGISACWVVIQAARVPVESGIGGLGALLVYAVTFDTLALGVLTISAPSSWDFLGRGSCDQWAAPAPEPTATPRRIGSHEDPSILTGPDRRPPRRAAGRLHPGRHDPARRRQRGPGPGRARIGRSGLSSTGWHHLLSTLAPREPSVTMRRAIGPGSGRGDDAGGDWNTSHSTAPPARLGMDPAVRFRRLGPQPGSATPGPPGG